MVKFMNLPLIASGILASTNTTVSFETIKPAIDALTGQITVANVVQLLAAVLGICVGFVFMWWGYRLATRKLMGAFKKGKA